MSYRPDDRRRRRAQRAALDVYSTLLGGSMGSRLFDEIREQRGLAYSVYAVDHVGADVRVLLLGAGLDSASASRPTRGCARSSPSCATTGPTEEEVDRARAYAAGRRVLGVREHERRRALRRRPGDRLRRGHRPRRRDRARSTP